MIDAFTVQDDDNILFDDEGEGNNSFFDDPDDESNKDNTKPLNPGEEPTDSTLIDQTSTKKLPTDLQKISFETDADLVFVIDCTGSMKPFLNMVKEHAKTMYQDIVKGLGGNKRTVHKLRIKVIAYRDYYFDWADPEHPPMAESEFFTLPDELDDYVAFVDKLEYSGGEDEPESALEALHLAFNSNWLVDPTIKKRRQIVMLFTDASAHPLDDPMRFDPECNSYYPEGMPESLEALENEYMSPDVFPPDADGNITGHRLVIFAPKKMYPWDKVEDWHECMIQNMDPETGLKELSMDEVITFLSGSIS